MRVWGGCGEELLGCGEGVVTVWRGCGEGVVRVW